LTQKRTTTVRRNGAHRSPARGTGSGPEGRPGGRRFAPSRKNVTEGGLVFGALLANRRSRLGLTQRELAARIGVSPSTIARAEQGHPQDGQILEKLYAVFGFDRPSHARRVVSKIAPRGPVPRPHISLGSRWLWAGVAMVAIALLILVVSSISGSAATSSLQPSVAVSKVPGAPASIQHARVHAEKVALVEARRAAAREREREAAAAAAAAAKKSAAKEARQSAAAAPQEVTATTAPSPAPSGGGGGSSSGPAPDLQHGIGTKGG
jgi:transcriptional regulator with XRE-family HTH domain